MVSLPPSDSQKVERKKKKYRVYFLVLKFGLAKAMEDTSACTFSIIALTTDRAKSAGKKPNLQYMRFALDAESHWTGHVLLFEFTFWVSSFPY